MTALVRGSGEIVIVGGGVEVLRSTDLAQTWVREDVRSKCLWPDVIEVQGHLLVSCSERRSPGRLLVVTEDPGRGWSAPVVVDQTTDLIIDTNLQELPGGEIVLFATHIDRPDDLAHAVYTLRIYRSVDGGERWSEAETIVVGRRGDHLEDTRSIVLGDGTLLLAYEIETVEGAASMVHQRRSVDGGRSWSQESVIWSGADVEPGGYILFSDGGLWFVASSDEIAGGGSYDRASILMRRSINDGRSWGAAEVIVDLEDQISFGGVVLPEGEILLPSLRHYNERERRQLSLYVVSRDLSRGVRCASGTISADGFEGGLGPQWRGLADR